MGMALLRRMKKGGGKAGSLSPMPVPPEEAPMPLLPPPAPKASPRHAGGPVVHIHIGPTSAGDPSLPEEPPEAGEPALPAPAMLQALHDKIQAARLAGRK